MATTQQYVEQQQPQPHTDPSRRHSNSSRRHSSSSSSRVTARMLLAALALLLLSPGSASASSNQEMKEVEVVEGQTVKLPCDIPMSKDDPTRKVQMIIWYKTSIREPIYVIKVSTMQTHIEAVLGSRAEFIREESSPHLLVEGVMRNDSGVYYCRVDYFIAPTEKRWSNLTVIVLPGVPTILEEDGTQVGETLGPYDEGATVTVTCQVLGGEPIPQVTWWRGVQHLNSQLERREGEVRNTLTLGPLTREHLDSFYTCQTSNTQLVGPVNKAVKLDVNYKPLTVEIEGPRGRLVAGKKNQMTCRSTGGRPPADLTWALQGNDLTSLAVKAENEGNTSTSRLSFVPTMEDSGKTLVCRARSPAIDHTPIVDGWTLDVEYAPELHLVLTHPKDPMDVREGDNVTFTCQVSANPPVESVAWYHKGLPLKADAEAGVTMNNFNISIANVRRQQQGIYTCLAYNDIGEGSSQAVNLDVKYLPLCSSPKVVSIGVALHHKVDLTCNMKASPEKVFFNWQVNITGILQPIQPTEHSEKGRTSVMTYTVNNLQDYGVVLCHGSNKMGKTTQPCVFEVVPAGKPETLKNCTVTNQTTDTLYAACLPGYNGGLTQHYVVNVFEFVNENQTKLLHNQTEMVEPTFILDGLRPGVSYLLSFFSENVKGRSEESVLHAFTMPPHPGSRSPVYIFPITPILGVLIGVVGALVLVAIVVVVVMKLRGDARRNPQRLDDAKHLPHVPLNPTKDGEDGPDVILCRADSAYEDVDGIPQKLKHVNIYETVPYDKEMSSRKSESSNPDDVEYAELTFSNGKNKQKNNKKSGTSGANGTIHADDNTIYAVIDHARTAQQQQRHLQQQQQQQQQNKAGKLAAVGNQDSQVQRQPDEIPLMDAALESSV